MSGAPTKLTFMLTVFIMDQSCPCQWRNKERRLRRGGHDKLFGGIFSRFRTCMNRISTWKAMTMDHIESTPIVGYIVGVKLEREILSLVPRGGPIQFKVEMKRQCHNAVQSQF